MQIRNIPIDSLKVYENNARSHSDAQIKEIAASIKEFGFNNPVLVDEHNMIIAGHGRLSAAKTLGLTEVPTIALKHLTDARKRAYILADNRIALNAGWDVGKLKEEFEAILTANIAFEVMGFTQEEIDAALNPELLKEGLDDANAQYELPKEPVTKLGDVWLLGAHRVMCGDSTMIDCVEKLLAGTKPILMVTDPPYGVNYDPEWREGADLGVGKRSRGKVENDDIVDWTDAYSLFSGDVAYVWHAGRYSPEVASHLASCGFELVSQIIWVKQHFALSRGDYHWQHEPCWYAVKKGAKHNWQGSRKETTTWEIKNNNSFGNSNKEETWGHGTQKPIECMLRPIQNNTKPNDSVYDPFGGSGTTLIAAEKIGRKCLMMEISPAYCDVIVRRWEKFSGTHATLEANGLSFDEVANGQARI